MLSMVVKLLNVIDGTATAVNSFLSPSPFSQNMVSHFKACYRQRLGLYFFSSLSISLSAHS